MSSVEVAPFILKTWKKNRKKHQQVRVWNRIIKYVSTVPRVAERVDLSIA